ncbi:MAG: hypothetical protein ACD_39C01497G0011 [uncultured bacterium]|nr:MAG: hypothetical protein ACD_39C01497G0011 [uncultured bacterium]
MKLKDFGFIRQFRDPEQIVKETSNLLSNACCLTKDDLDSILNETIISGSMKYFSKSGKETTVQESLFAFFGTGRMNDQGQELLAYFKRKDLNYKWAGVYFDFSIQDAVAKVSLFEFGLINKKKDCVTDLNSMMHEGQLTFEELDNIFQSVPKNFFNHKGESVISSDLARYLVFSTEQKTSSGDLINGVFTNQYQKGWVGCDFLTASQFESFVVDQNTFKMGLIFFESFPDGIQFLTELGKMTIPERWSYTSYKSSIPNPILKAYIENLYEKLNTEKQKEKLLISDDRSTLLFNTGLLDKFFHPIFLIGEPVFAQAKVKCKNPRIKKSFFDLKNFFINGEKFSEKHEPKMPTFFSDIKEVIYNTDLQIDVNFAKFEHIVEERRDRFPKKFKDNTAEHLARLLDSAIKSSLAMAERNYKFIVPQYRPKEDKIQFLLPIYLEGSFNEEHPDFALVLNLEDDIYIPETILPLDAAYQNARLIAKPDDMWLDPRNF